MDNKQHENFKKIDDLISEIEIVNPKAGEIIKKRKKSIGTKRCSNLKRFIADSFQNLFGKRESVYTYADTSFRTIHKILYGPANFFQGR